MKTDKKPSPEAGPARFCIYFLTLCMLAIGALFSWWMSVRTDRDLRANLLEQARMVARAVDIEQVKTLTGTEADLKSPIYLRLKDRFAAVNSANPHSRFVYLMGRRTDGEVFFFLDSEPVGSADESPAGQIFNEASADLLRAFDSQTEIVEGPISDSWGKWVSVLVPLTDPKNGKMVALLGMDIDARSWHWQVAGKVALPISLALMLLGLSISIIVLTQSRRQILIHQETLRKSEEKYSLLNAELELKIEKRSRDLLDAQEELVRKEKLAILGQLSGSVGHELRNPLGVMSNAVYFLQMVLTDADETVKEYLNIINNEIDISLRIITDLLDFARTRALQIEAVTVRRLIDESLGKCTIPENVALQTEIPDNLPLLNLDPLQMGQVLQNLIMNAIQAMPDGGTLRVSARFAEATAGEHAHGGDRRNQIFQDSIEISVTDSGEGIAPENIEKLFQPLFTTKAKGIGLGLVVCKNLVEANGGCIKVESKPGEGTSFRLWLSIDRREADEVTAR